MKKKLTRGVLSGFVAAVLLLAYAIVPGSGLPGGSAVYAASEIEITGYTVYYKGTNTVPERIETGNELTITLAVTDNRAEAQTATHVTARVNSASFTKISEPIHQAVTPSGGTPSTLSYNLTFEVRYNGQGKSFQTDISYEGATAPLFPYTLTLNQCAEYVAPAPNPEPPMRGTGFVLRNATYGLSEVTAGQSFQLKADILATNGTYNVENTSVTLVLPKDITFATGSSVSYIGTVAPGQTVPAKFDLLPIASIEEGSYTITVNISGINAKDGSAVSASADITVPIIQPERFEISNATLPEYLVVGTDDGSGYFSVDLINKGKSSVYNVEAEIVGDGLSAEEGKQFIGTIAGGAKSSADGTMLADQAGIIQAAVIITYENARGEVKTLTRDFSITVEETGMGGDDGFLDPGLAEDPGEVQAGFPKWGWALIILVVLAAAVTTLLILLKKRKKKRAAALEAELAADAEDFVPQEELYP
ncbi:MAG: hypothetical protein LBN36_02450 [Clostridiales Family XIII bacterium]|jgi:hypothetical protein|nr:hypothetical protein [Clostridiales Family XIII bacterium]